MPARSTKRPVTPRADDLATASGIFEMPAVLEVAADQVEGRQHIVQRQLAGC